MENALLVAWGKIGRNKHLQFFSPKYGGQLVSFVWHGSGLRGRLWIYYVVLVYLLKGVKPCKTLYSTHNAVAVVVVVVLLLLLFLVLAVCACVLWVVIVVCSVLVVCYALVVLVVLASCWGWAFSNSISKSSSSTGNICATYCEGVT